MRRSFTVVSVGVHSVVIAAALLAQLVADGALPTPHRPILFDSSQFMPVDIQLPPPPHVGPVKAASASAGNNAAPVVAPDAIVPEIPGAFEALPIGTISGVQNGPPAGFDGVGIHGEAPPPPPAPEPIAPIRLHSGMKAPVKIADVAPEYPPIARNAHIQGVVILEAVLDAQGHVESVRVLRSIAMLDQAAVSAVKQWRFSPALLNGQPVPVVMTVTVNFNLQ